MIISDEQAMLAFGSELAGSLKKGDWLALEGPLGSGKTVLCTGIMRGLGYRGEVTSPSYAIIHNYDPPDLAIAVAHADLYRVEDASELEEIGLADGFEERVTLVEWAERGNAYHVRPTHHIWIVPQSDGSRLLKLEYS